MGILSYYQSYGKLHFMVMEICENGPKFNPCMWVSLELHHGKALF